MRGLTIPHPTRGVIDVTPGPALLAGLLDGPGLPAHEDRYGALPALRARDLAGLADSVELQGRGGAAFPFSRKVTAVDGASRRGRTVVVNLSEGEPASLKDAALVQAAPHLVLDGAVVTAGAIGARTVHLVLPGESAVVGHAVRRALAERSAPRTRRAAGRDGEVDWVLHDAAESFVAGQSAAVLELMAGRPNLPVTTWQPSAVSGFRGRPTLLSNAETFAHVGRLALLGVADHRRHGTPDEPGTTLLTVDGDRRQGRPRVLEVAFGTPWSAVLGDAELAEAVLLGGYHGTWASGETLRGTGVSPSRLRSLGLSLGAGVVLPLGDGCPVDRTSRIVSYLASQSARRCGPCLNGLPALARAVEAVRTGDGGLSELERLGALVEGRGACAHPDGTVRLVRSLVRGFRGELAHHAQGGCGALRGDRRPLTAVEVSA